MAGKIRDEDIGLVRERTSIVDVISEQVTLKPAGGGNLKGLCPFHDEKTPSFTVSSARNVYFCHGCGAGGDAIRFVMETDHLTFVEAVERLAGKAGIQLRYVEAGPAPIRQQGQKQRLIAAHAEAAAFYAAGVPGAARLRPGRGAAVRLRVRAGDLGRTGQAPAPEGLHGTRADHRRPRQGGPLRLPDRPVPAPAAVADPRPGRRRDRLRRAQALRRR